MVRIQNELSRQQVMLPIPQGLDNSIKFFYHKTDTFIELHSIVIGVDGDSETFHVHTRWQKKTPLFQSHWIDDGPSLT